MTKQIKGLRLLGIALMAVMSIAFTSCDKESTLIDVEEFTDNSIANIQSRAVGKNYCLEFIFPVSIRFSDETIAEVSSYENLHETVKVWFETNEVEKSKENRPQLVFPIQVINQEGEIVDVASQELLKELKQECPKTGKCKSGKNGKGYKCFSLVFPISVSINSSAQSFENNASLKEAIRQYREEAGDNFERPKLIYPVTVEYEDGSQVEVASEEELQALKEACKEDE